MKGTKLTRNLWILRAGNESYAQASQVANGKDGTWCANDVITEQIFPTNEKLKQWANGSVSAVKEMILMEAFLWVR